MFEQKDIVNASIAAANIAITNGAEVPRWDQKFFGYIRVSGAAQIEKDGPRRQRQAIKEFHERNRLPGVLRFYDDLGVSGAIEGLERPGFIEMIQDAVNEGVTGIIVERMDRLARDLVVSEFMIRVFRERGLELYAADQGLMDLTSDGNVDPSRTLIRQIFAAMAQYDKSALVLKLRAARDRKRKQTGKCEGKKPYGKNREEAIILELVKNLRMAGFSYAQIALRFSQQHIRKRSGKREWTGQEIWSLFKNLCRREELQSRIEAGRPPNE